MAHVVFFEVNSKGLLELYVIRIAECTNLLVRMPVGGLVREVDGGFSKYFEYVQNNRATIYSSKEEALDAIERIPFVGLRFDAVKLLETG